MKNHRCRHKETIDGICTNCDKLMSKVKKRGGKRKGSGRPKLKASDKKETTKVIRVPVSLVSHVVGLIKNR